MKKLFSIGLALAVSAVLSIGAATDTAGWGINVPQGLDNPPVVSLTYKQTNHWPAGPVTNGAQFILTNVVIPVYPDQSIGIYGLFGAQFAVAGSTTNTFMLYGDLSADGGRTWTTHRPTTLTNLALVPNSNAPYVPAFSIPYTNLASAQLFRLTSISNNSIAGSLNHLKVWPTNITLITRKHPFWGR